MKNHGADGKGAEAKEEVAFNLGSEAAKGALFVLTMYSRYYLHG